MDELGGNINHKGDGHIGGKLHMCERGTTSPHKISSKDKQYTLLGITTSSGEPVMCVIIFTGIRRNVLWETGLDLSADAIGDPDGEEFFQNNCRKDKKFPIGPECIFKGETVPCLCCWSPKVSITL